MKSKETKKIQRIEEKISRLLIEKQKIRSSTCRSKPLSKVRRLMIFRIFGWKIAIAKHKNTRGSRNYTQHRVFMPFHKKNNQAKCDVCTLLDYFTQSL